MWVWYRINNVSWQDHIKNTEILRRIKERKIINVMTKRRGTWIGHCMRKRCLLVDELEGLVNGKIGKGMK